MSGLQILFTKIEPVSLSMVKIVPSATGAIRITTERVATRSMKIKLHITGYGSYYSSQTQKGVENGPDKLWMYIHKTDTPELSGGSDQRKAKDSVATAYCFDVVIDEKNGQKRIKWEVNRMAEQLIVGEDEEWEKLIGRRVTVRREGDDLIGQGVITAVPWQGNWLL